MAITKRTQHCNAMQSDILKACHILLSVKRVFNGIEESLRESWSETEVLSEKLQIYKIFMNEDFTDFLEGTKKTCERNLCHEKLIAHPRTS